MLDDARAGDLPVLGDVTHQHHGDAALLGQADQFAGAGADLGDRARSRFVRIAPQRLNRIDDDQIESRPLEPVEDVAKRGLRRQLHRCAGGAHAVRPGADLLHGFFAGDVGAGRAASRGGGAYLQQQRGFADAGIAGQQDRRTRDNAAAAYAVKLFYARHDAWRRRRVGLKALEGEPARLQSTRRRQRPGGTRGAFLHQGVPRRACRALPGPLGVDRAAGLADVDGAVAGHGAPDSDDATKLQARGHKRLRSFA